jgi:glycosyltransferase involved in cell wall biosynthesis
MSFRLSVAIPAHNEEDVLAELLRRVATAMDSIEGGPHEIVIVDDGSTDQTWTILEQAAQHEPRLTVVGLSRNFGHQAALAAALDHVSGDAVVLMDADLQDDPNAIGRFVQKYQEGYDVVYAKRIRRKEPWWLRALYYTFYRLIAHISDMRLPLDAGDFGLISSRVVEQLRKMREHHRYLRGLRSWAGFRQIGIEVERNERYAGRSKYNLLRLIKLAMDGIFAFSIVPIRAATVLGALAMVVPALYVVYSIIAKLFFNQAPQGFTALVSLITFAFGVQLIFFGIIGEYVGRIYEEVKARPLYIASKVIQNGTEAPVENAASTDHVVGGR